MCSSGAASLVTCNDQQLALDPQLWCLFCTNDTGNADDDRMLYDDDDDADNSDLDVDDDANS